MALEFSGRLNSVTCIVFLCLTTILVVARFAGKVAARQRLQGPDWLCLLTLLLFYAFCGLILHHIYYVSTSGAFDTDITLGIDEFRNALLVSYCTELLFASMMTTIKLSLLWLYYKLFALSTTLHRTLIAAAILCILWFLISFFVAAFQCTPPDQYWMTLGTHPSCMNPAVLQLGFEISNLVIDALILTIPAFMIGQLKLHMAKKAGVMFIFLLGGLVCVSSIVRLEAIWRPPNATENLDFPFVFMWATVQAGLAIICSCLPTLKPAVKLLHSGFSFIARSYGSIRSKESTSGTHDNASNQIRADGQWVEMGEEHHKGLHEWRDQRGENLK